MNEIKIKKNIKKVLTLKGKSTILFSENQERQTPFEWIKNKEMELKKMKLNKEQKSQIETLRNGASKRYNHLGFADSQFIIKTNAGEHISIEFERVEAGKESFKVFLESKVLVFVSNSNFLTSGQLVNLINASLKDCE